MRHAALCRPRLLGKEGEGARREAATAGEATVERRRR